MVGDEIFERDADIIKQHEQSAYGAYRIRPLVWIETCGACETCRAVFLDYAFTIFNLETKFSCVLFREGQMLISIDYKTLPEAKAAAQDWYESKIKEALERVE